MAQVNPQSNIPQSFAQAVSIEIGNAIVAFASGTAGIGVRILTDLQRKAEYYTRKAKSGYNNQNHENMPSEADPANPDNY